MPLPMIQDIPKNKLGIASSTKIYGIASGKGGVGKSTLTAMLAVLSQKSQKSVGLLDADLYGPSIKKMLPEERLVKQSDNMIEPALSKGIKTLSLGHFRQESQASIVRAPIANGMVQQFIHQVAWGELDELFVDFPPGTGDIQLTLSQQLTFSGIILITTPQEIALLDVVKAYDMFRQLNIPIVGLVENMSYFENGNEKTFIFGEGRGREVARQWGIPFLGQIPLDSAIASSCDKGCFFEGEMTKGQEAVCSIYDNFVAQCSLREKKFEIEGLDLLMNWNKEALVNEKKDQEILNSSQELKNSFQVGEVCFPKEIYQIDKKTLGVLWQDGCIQQLNLNFLQAHCPCANCSTKENEKALEKDFFGISGVHLVGQYALKIYFNKGCNYGIFDFSLLRELGNKAVSYG
jgi:ATP-binding protein involved in chromosome partitioning